MLEPADHVLGGLYHLRRGARLVVVVDLLDVPEDQGWGPLSPSRDGQLVGGLEPVVVPALSDMEGEGGLELFRAVFAGAQGYRVGPLWQGACIVGLLLCAS